METNHHFGESKVIALYVAKAFHRVWRDVLVLKLTTYGVDRIFGRFVSSFLSNRSIRRYSLNEIYLHTKVPQDCALFSFPGAY